ncbi:MAG: hypothetical protein F6K23_39580 [Okeania sp. SIO2C9]|uniref:hypothetical protein n=1 Tax=Okeania sp. SIO2C9 TaxID=2607791 RepID=UPI0013C13773|nr:hypothetical protein [Okeania sp. SIO2C9]NEQ78562.1 hypothetical protein [Okeania sp. SIO2C9]
MNTKSSFVTKMPLTLQQRFGASATLSNGKLQITIADLAAVGLDVTQPNADQILASLILLNIENQPATASEDPTVGVIIADSFKTFASRGEQSQLEYQKTLSLYTADPTSAIDPDDLVG